MKRLNIEKEIHGEATYLITELPIEEIAINILNIADIYEVRVDHISNVVRIEEPISVEKAKTFLWEQSPSIYNVTFDLKYTSLPIIAIVDYHTKF